MAGGGYRPGAGRKRKALTMPAIRTLEAVAYGMSDGIIEAGRQIVPGADDVVALRRAVQEISYQEVQSGRGVRMVELLAAISERLSRIQEEGEVSSGSSILDAFSRLPGAGQAAGSNPASATLSVAGLADSGTLDCESSARPSRGLMPVQPTMFPALAPRHAGGPSAAGGGAGPEAPLPPRRPSPPHLDPHPEIFENAAGVRP